MLYVYMGNENKKHPNHTPSDALMTCALPTVLILHSRFYISDYKLFLYGGILIEEKYTAISLKQNKQKTQGREC